jgi:hypothetical protein
VVDDEKDEDICSIFSGKEGTGGTMIKSSAVPCQKISRTREKGFSATTLSLSIFTDSSGAEKQ